MNRAQRMRLQRERDNHPDAFRNTAEQDLRGNVGVPGGAGAMRLDRAEDYEIFDVLPRPIRDMMNHTRGKYSAREVRGLWHTSRDQGLSARAFARAVKERDEELFT